MPAAIHCLFKGGNYGVNLEGAARESYLKRELSRLHEDLD